MNKKMLGSSLAVAFVAALASQGVLAHDDHGHAKKTNAKGDEGICCNAKNACKGTAACHGCGNNSCAGKNDCGGHGQLSKDGKAVKDAAACTKAGGKWKKS